MVIEKVKNTASWTYLIEEFNSEVNSELLERYIKKNCK